MADNESGIYLHVTTTVLLSKYFLSIRVHRCMPGGTVPGYLESMHIDTPQTAGTPRGGTRVPSGRQILI